MLNITTQTFLPLLPIVFTLVLCFIIALVLPRVPIEDKDSFKIHFDCDYFKPGEILRAGDGRRMLILKYLGNGSYQVKFVR